MPRKHKYDNPQATIDAFYHSVSDSYNHPTSPSEVGDVSGRKKQELIAEEFGISRLKVRKILITTGDLHYPETTEIQKLMSAGMELPEICVQLKMAASTVNSFLPYSKGVYKLSEVSAAAERTALYRLRTAAVQELKATVETGTLDEQKLNLWKCVCLFAGYPFMTAGRGKDRADATKFSYTIPSSVDRRGGGRKYDGEDVDGFGNELLIIPSSGDGKGVRREKGISRSSVGYALSVAVENGGLVKGPKQLKIYGASYVHAMFLRFEVIDVGDGSAE